MINEWHTPSWDELFMREAYLIATKSKDPHTKIGCVLVKDNIALMKGYNGIPRRVYDDIAERNERPTKYFYYEHSERNCIFNCARNGIATGGASLYCFALPCSDCCRAIIQSGIVQVIIHKQWDDVGINKNSDKWIESSRHSEIMLFEAGIPIKVLDIKLGVKTMIDGKVFEV
jgi:dCMP deaminase